VAAGRFGEPNAFFRGFNRVYKRFEDGYEGIIAWLVAPGAPRACRVRGADPR
jgi:hypothetical protein